MVLPSSKVTVPAGIPVVAVTVACNVTFCPCKTDAGIFRAVVGAAAGARNGRFVVTVELK